VQAAFFLPHLSPGMRLLDCGCGPGSITAGLAAAVSPGECIGIDISPDRIAVARQTHVSDANLRFEVADVESLPFDDADFDAAFLHTVLQHVNPSAAIAQCARVLRPDGVIGISDADFGGSLIFPSNPALEKSLNLMARLREVGNGSPFVGRSLGVLLDSSGFTSVRISAVAHTESTPDATAGTGAFWGRYFSSPALVDYAVAMSLASRAELEAIASAWTKWGGTAGACWGRWSFTAVGRKSA